jgi:hypothetical protein
MYLMNNGIPRETSVIHNDVHLAVAKFGGLLDQLLDVVVLQEVTRYSDCLAAVGIDLVCDLLRLGSVNVRNNYFCALVGE